MDFFDSAYRGTPPWDIGRPQKEFVELVWRGEITGSVLDIGCGTGEHALFFAAEGHEVWGIDSAPLAIEKAREKAARRGLPVHFLVLDALHMAELIRKFDTGRELRSSSRPGEKLPGSFSTATDSGLFHTLSDEDRPVFVENLAAVLAPAGKYFMLCFSDLEPGGYGPRRVSQKEIRDSFRDGWSINYIRPAVFESRTRAEGPRAWLSSISRDPDNIS
ncbi:MAG TPA: class I SAM-dependent methyltransferase [Methanomicrobiales archaeon]|jgi:SAM-dependent methyltransferase|nr:class I SAM-dependent methyltransferase [Methanomicrobiales archaeon]